MPVAVATVRGIRRGWLPVGDNALFAIRTRDVFTIDHHPLVGTWSSASAGTGVEVHHPGPLLFQLLAVPTRLFDGGSGMAFGVALLNGAALVGIAVFAYRRGGPLVGTATIAAAAALSWSMGSELLYEPWGPHSVLLPFLFFLVLVWSVACGDLAALPFAAGVGSFVLQTHLSYALLVPILGAWALVGLFIGLRRDRRDAPGTWPRLRRRASRTGALAGAVFFLCWLAPLIEQFTSGGRGNLAALAEGGIDPGEAVGLSLGTRLVASVVALPRWWLRGSFWDASEAAVSLRGWRPTSAPVAGVALLLVVAVLAAALWAARRRRDRDLVMLLGTASLALAAALATTLAQPLGAFGIQPHQFRFLWPIGAFVWLAVIVTLVVAIAGAPGDRPPISPRLVAVLAVVTVVVAAANLPIEDRVGRFQAAAIPVMHELNRQLATHDVDGVVLVEGTAAFGDPYGSAVMAELQRRGIPFVVGEGLVARRHLGTARTSTGHHFDHVLTVVYRDAAREPRPGARRVAFHDGLSPSERRELGRLRRQITAFVERGEVRLNAAGQRVLRSDRAPGLGALADGTADIEEVFEERLLVFAVGFDLLDLDEPWARRVERYVELRDQADTQTVGLFLEPAPD